LSAAALGSNVLPSADSFHGNDESCETLDQLLALPVGAERSSVQIKRTEADIITPIGKKARKERQTVVLCALAYGQRSNGGGSSFVRCEGSAVLSWPS